MKVEEIEVKEEECGSERVCVRCYHCGEERLSKEELKEHIYSHNSSLFVDEENGGDVSENTDEKPFKCNVCNYRTSRRFRLKEHFCKHTEKIEAKEQECGSERECVRCFHCGEERLSKEELREHIYSHHSLLFVCKRNGGDIGANTDEKPFKCDVCEYRTAVLSRMKHHSRKHTGEKPYECDVCEFRTASHSNLKIHSFKHTGEKPFKCKVCVRTSRRIYLKEHICKHTNEKPWKCDMYEYITAYSSNFKIHTSKHTGELPYKCDVCEYSTKHKNNLRLHKLNHTGEKLSNVMCVDTELIVFQA
ncbi:hypothetical protein J437_LFUL003496 [Ladona fulva]|uniref:C2H2-type domain-containing protein n=1 Tax=Ladona fulva TaxID=123851 RepID=A0A8K0JWE3_LADFU|nr:hypothetical protein J437_LFUL003496 [Ladona fulva]